MRLDSRDKFPSGMNDYLGFYDWHFSKKMCNWAVSIMQAKSKTSFTPMEKEKVELILKDAGVLVDLTKGYDHVYLANMAKCLYSQSVKDDKSLASFVNETMLCYKTVAFTRFYADCIGKGTPIPWEDVI